MIRKLSKGNNSQIPFPLLMRYITSLDIVKIFSLLVGCLVVYFFFLFRFVRFFLLLLFLLSQFYYATSFISAVKMQKGQSFNQICKTMIRDVDQGLAILMFIDQTSSKNINP